MSEVYFRMACRTKRHSLEMKDVKRSSTSGVISNNAKPKGRHRRWNSFFEFRWTLAITFYHNYKRERGKECSESWGRYRIASLRSYNVVDQDCCRWIVPKSFSDPLTTGCIMQFWPVPLLTVTIASLSLHWQATCGPQSRFSALHSPRFTRQIKLMVREEGVGARDNDSLSWLVVNMSLWIYQIRPPGSKRA
jgi:hypothetical protein